MAPAAEVPAPAWLVCLGVHHEVVRGAVACPLSESTVPVAECLACRHLGYVAEERRESRWCSTGGDYVSSSEGSHG